MRSYFHCGKQNTSDEKPSVQPHELLILAISSIDDKESIRLYEQVIELDYFDGINIAFSWLIDHFTNKDSVKAIQYQEQAVSYYQAIIENDSRKTEHSIAFEWLIDHFLKFSEEIAIQYCLQAKKKDVSLYQRHLELLARYYESTGNYIEAVKHYLDSGSFSIFDSLKPYIEDHHACLTLSNALLWLGEKSKLAYHYEIAEIYYSIVVGLDQANKAIAAFLAGEMIEKNESSEARLNQMLYYYHIAATQHHSAAIVKIMEYALKGYGEPVSPKDYIHHLNMLAEKDQEGHIKFKLAWYYKTGTYVERNIAKAIDLFTQVINLKPSISALTHIAECYELPGPTNSELKALNYFGRAAQMGSFGALSRLTKYRVQHRYRIPFPVTFTKQLEYKIENKDSHSTLSNSSLESHGSKIRLDVTSSKPVDLILDFSIRVNIIKFLESDEKGETKNSLIKHSPSSIDDTTLEIKDDSTIINLDYSNQNNIDPDFLADVLKSKSSLVKVDYSNNVLRGKGIRSAAKILSKHKTLKSLDLSRNSITDQGAYYLAIAIEENDTLQELDLSHNAISNIGVALLVHALKKNTSLICLSLDGNPQSMSSTINYLLRRNAFLKKNANNPDKKNRDKIKLALIAVSSVNVDIALQRIRIPARSSTDSVFEIPVNQISFHYKNQEESDCIVVKELSALSQEEISTFFSQIKQHDHVQSLECHQGRIPSYYISNLISSMPNLRQLTLFNMEFSYPDSSLCGSHLIGEALSTNQSLHGLSLINCTLNMKCLQSILIALKKNRSLRYLDIYGTEITQEFIRAIADALLQNTSLLECNIINPHQSPQRLEDKSIDAALRRNKNACLVSPPTRLFDLVKLKNIVPSQSIIGSEVKREEKSTPNLFNLIYQAAHEHDQETLHALLTHVCLDVYDAKEMCTPTAKLAMNGDKEAIHFLRTHFNPRLHWLAYGLAHHKDKTDVLFLLDEAKSSYPDQVGNIITYMVKGFVNSENQNEIYELQSFVEEKYTEEIIQFILSMAANLARFRSKEEIDSFLEKAKIKYPDQFTQILHDIAYGFGRAGRKTESNEYLAFVKKNYPDTYYSIVAELGYGFARNQYRQFAYDCLAIAKTECPQHLETVLGYISYGFASGGNTSELEDYLLPKVITEFPESVKSVVHNAVQSLAAHGYKIKAFQFLYSASAEEEEAILWRIVYGLINGFSLKEVNVFINYVKDNYTKCLASVLSKSAFAIADRQSHLIVYEFLENAKKEYPEHIPNILKQISSGLAQSNSKTRINAFLEKVKTEYLEHFSPVLTSVAVGLDISESKPDLDALLIKVKSEYSEHLRAVLSAIVSRNVRMGSVEKVRQLFIQIKNNFSDCIDIALINLGFAIARYRSEQDAYQFLEEVKKDYPDHLTSLLANIAVGFSVNHDEHIIYKFLAYIQNEHSESLLPVLVSSVNAHFTHDQDSKAYHLLVKIQFDFQENLSPVLISVTLSCIQNNSDSKVQLFLKHFYDNHPHKFINTMFNVLNDLFKNDKKQMLNLLKNINLILPSQFLRLSCLQVRHYLDHQKIQEAMEWIDEIMSNFHTQREPFINIIARYIATHLNAVNVDKFIVQIKTKYPDSLPQMLFLIPCTYIENEASVEAFLFLAKVKLEHSEYTRRVLNAMIMKFASIGNYSAVNTYLDEYREKNSKILLTQLVNKISSLYGTGGYLTAAKLFLEKVLIENKDAAETAIFQITAGFAERNHSHQLSEFITDIQSNHPHYVPMAYCGATTGFVVGGSFQDAIHAMDYLKMHHPMHVTHAFDAISTHFSKRKTSSTFWNFLFSIVKNHFDDKFSDLVMKLATSKDEMMKRIDKTIALKILTFITDASKRLAFAESLKSMIAAFNPVSLLPQAATLVQLMKKHQITYEQAFASTQSDALFFILQGYQLVHKHPHFKSVFFSVVSYLSPLSESETCDLSNKFSCKLLPARMSAQHPEILDEKFDSLTFFNTLKKKNIILSVSGVNSPNPPLQSQLKR